MRFFAKICHFYVILFGNMGKMYYLCRKFRGKRQKLSEATDARRGDRLKIGKNCTERTRMLDGGTIEDPFSILSVSIEHPLQVGGT